MMMSEEFFISLGYFLTCVMDVSMLYIFCGSIFKRRWESYYFIGAYFIATTTIFYINSFHISRLNLLCVPFILLLLVLITFKISFSDAVAYTTLFFVTFSGGKEVAFAILNRFLSSTFPVVYMGLAGSGEIHIIIVEYLLGFLLLLFTVRHTKTLNISESNGFSWYLLIIPVASMVILISFLYMDYPEKRIIQFLMCSGASLLYLSNITIFVILAKYTDITNRMKDMEIYTMRSELEVENFRKVKELYEKNRQFIHDSHAFNSNIRMLAARAEDKLIIELIDELEGKMHREIVEAVYSANPILDTILSERIIKCEVQGIEIKLFSEPLLNVDFIQASDMVSMFGNLLDNAIEAAARCVEEQRKITVKLFMANDFILVFHISNSFTVQVQKDGEKYLTTKVDKQAHGLGIGIVRSLAAKYGGKLELLEKDGQFNTILTLSNAFFDTK